MLRSVVMFKTAEQVMSHLLLTDKERQGELGLKRNQRGEMSYLHISKIHHRTAIKGLVNRVLHIERNFHCFSERAVYMQF